MRYLKQLFEDLHMVKAPRCLLGIVVPILHQEKHILSSHYHFVNPKAHTRYLARNLHLSDLRAKSTLHEHFAEAKRTPGPWSQDPF